MKRKPNQEIEDWRFLLDLCDEFSVLRGPETEDSPQAEIVGNKTKLHERLTRRLRRPGVQNVELVRYCRSNGFDTTELTLVLILFHRRLTDPDCSMSGRDLLWFISDSSFDLLVNTRHLDAKSRLLRCCTITILNQYEGDPDDTLNLDYMLSEELFKQFSTHRVPDVEIPDAEESEPFADNTDYFLALAQLSVAHQMRAAKLFEFSLWRELHEEPFEPGEVLNHRIEILNERLQQRLVSTAQADQFEFRVFQREFGLTDPEINIVVALLHQELMAGGPYVEIIDLIRLVSNSTRDLLRKRQLLTLESPLIASQIIEIEDLRGGKTASGQATLSPWASKRLLDGSLRMDGNIASDEKMEFHNYLSHLHDSDDFFDNLQ